MKDTSPLISANSMGDPPSSSLPISWVAPLTPWSRLLLALSWRPDWREMPATIRHIAKSSLPGLDDWIGSSIRATMALMAWGAANIAPSPADKFLHIVAHAFAIMTVWRLIGVIEGRVQRHIIDWVRQRIGAPRKAIRPPEDPLA